MEETIRSEINRHHELVTLTKQDGFLVSYYTVYVDGRQRHVFKDLSDAMREFESWL